MRKFIFLLCLFFFSVSCAKPIEILFWHSMAGQLGLELQTIIDNFNHRQTRYIIKPVYKGDYIESLTSFAAAFQAHQPPALIQVFEVGTTSMLSPKGIIKPVDELMREQGLTLPEENFFPAVLNYYKENGHLMAMPFNVSIPVMYYNADALQKLGYSSTSFPKTWDAFEHLARRLLKSGYHCAYTSAYPGWILIESFSALHHLPMTNPASNVLTYNNQSVVRHLERLQRWQRFHFFEYGGRGDDATVLFTSGRCAILSQSSGAYKSLSQLVKFQLGVASLPLDNQASSHRYNNVIGGAAIWAVSGQTPQTYQGIAQFFSYLAQSNTQQSWHTKTGYLPLGIEGQYKEIAAASQLPTLFLAQSELMNMEVRNQTRHFYAQNQIRAINDEALETIFAGVDSPQQALDEAVIRANHVLRRFIKNTQ